MAVPPELAETTLPSPGKVSLFPITSPPALKLTKDARRVPGPAAGALHPSPQVRLVHEVLRSFSDTLASAPKGGPNRTWPR